MTYTFGAGDGTLTANYQGGEITLPEAVREGYKFEGWFTEATGGTLIGNLGSKYIPSKDETIYAHWTINSYTLTVNPNGGTWNGKTENSTITQNFGSVVDIPDPTPPNGYTITFDGDGGNAPDPITATKIFVDWTKDGAGELNQKVYTFGEGDATLTANYEDGVIVLPSANKEGYELNGWINEAGDFVGKPGDEYKTVKDETLTPQWVPNTYTVAFDGNSASGNMTSIEMTYGVEKNLPNNVFTKVGYTFIGWNIDRNATSAQYTDGQSVINLTTENGATVTLYAIWKKDIVISYDANGGSGAPASQTGTMYNSATSVDIKLSDTRPIKEGFSFNGWTDEESSTNVKYQAGGTYSFSSDTTLYAVWGTNCYILTVNPNGGTWNNTTDVSEVSGSYGSTTIIPDPIPPVGDNITFDGNGGSTPEVITSIKVFTGWTEEGPGTLDGTTYTFGAGSGTLTANYENSEITLPTPTRTGYTCLGWYTAASGGEKRGDVGGKYTPSTSETLYAQWEANTYTIVFNPNGGTGNMSDLDMTYDVEKNLTNNAFIKAGYEFVGWNTNKDLTESQYTDGQTVSNLTIENGATVTLYAIWKKDIVISYDANGGEGAPADQIETLFN